MSLHRLPSCSLFSGCLLSGCLLALALCASGVQAQALDAWLPSTEQVAPTLHASPLIQAARARQDAQLQRARGLEAGSG